MRQLEIRALDLDPRAARGLGAGGKAEQLALSYGAGIGSAPILPSSGSTGTGAAAELFDSLPVLEPLSNNRAWTQGLGDRNGDGRVDHLDVWLTRGMGYLNDPDL